MASNICELLLVVQELEILFLANIESFWKQELYVHILILNL